MVLERCDSKMYIYIYINRNEGVIMSVIHALILWIKIRLLQTRPSKIMKERTFLNAFVTVLFLSQMPDIAHPDFQIIALLFAYKILKC